MKKIRSNTRDLAIRGKLHIHVLIITLSICDKNNHIMGWPRHRNTDGLKTNYLDKVI